MISQSNSEIAAPKDAATVILVREKNKKPFELYLMRRHRKQSFMGGAYVFPGGALDAADCDADLTQHMKGISLEDAVNQLNESDTPQEKVLGLYFTAVRETFEEAGVLLADIEDDAINGNFTDHFNGYREQIHDGKLSLKEFAARENILYAMDLLIPYSRWITPEVESKRFDTRFFLAKKPKNQNPEHDRIELVDSLWITPEEALEKNARKEIMLMPPTLKTIEELSSYSSIDELFDFVSASKVEPILPQAFQAETGFGVMLPHDPEYVIEAYKQPPREDDPSRVVNVGGKFQTFFPNSPEAALPNRTTDLNPFTGRK